MDLKEYESRVLGAEEARLQRETALFQELRRRVRQETSTLKQVARALGICLGD
jgi:DNA mismatch repair ATPase MutS